MTEHEWFDSEEANALDHEITHKTALGAYRGLARGLESTMGALRELANLGYEFPEIAGEAQPVERAMPSACEDAGGMAEVTFTLRLLKGRVLDMCEAYYDGDAEMMFVAFADGMGKQFLDACSSSGVWDDPA